jgi:hypothetical protein
MRDPAPLGVWGVATTQANNLMILLRFVAFVGKGLVRKIECQSSRAYDRYVLRVGFGVSLHVETTGFDRTRL